MGTVRGQDWKGNKDGSGVRLGQELLALKLQSSCRVNEPTLPVPSAVASPACTHPRARTNQPSAGAHGQREACAHSKIHCGRYV